MGSWLLRMIREIKVSSDWFGYVLVISFYTAPLSERILSNTTLVAPLAYLIMTSLRFSLNERGTRLMLGKLYAGPLYPWSVPIVAEHRRRCDSGIINISTMKTLLVMGRWSEAVSLFWSQRLRSPWTAHFSELFISRFSTYIRKRTFLKMGSFHQSKRSDRKRYTVEVRWGIFIENLTYFFIP